MKAKVTHGQELYEIWKDIFPQFASFVTGYTWKPEFKNQILILGGDDNKVLFVFSYKNGTTWRFESVKYLVEEKNENNS